MHHGHGAGDQVLIEVARRLHGCIRAGDTAARLGGDEFALLLEDTPDAASAREVTGRITAALKDPILIDAKEVFLSASCGVAIGVPGEPEEELLRNRRRPVTKEQERASAKSSSPECARP